MADARDARGAEQAGTIVNVSGIVLVRDVTGQGGPAGKAKPGDRIHEGHVINTASDASVKILMSDKTIVDLGPSSLFKVDEYKSVGKDDRKASLDLEYGRVRALVTKKIGSNSNFRIRTRSATMGVRGTEFVVMSDLVGMEPPKSEAPAPGSSAGAGSAGPRMKVVVLEGKVEVTGKALENSARKTIALTEGKQLTAKAAGGEAKREPAQAAPEPVVETLDEKEQEEVAKENRVPDNTFKREVEIDKNVAGGGSSPLSELKNEFELGLPEMAPMTADNFSASEFHGLVGQTVKLTVKFNTGGGGL